MHLQGSRSWSDLTPIASLFLLFDFVFPAHQLNGFELESISQGSFFLFLLPYTIVNKEVSAARTQLLMMCKAGRVNFVFCYCVSSAVVTSRFHWLN